MHSCVFTPLLSEKIQITLFYVYFSINFYSRLEIRFPNQMLNCVSNCLWLLFFIQVSVLNTKIGTKESFFVQCIKKQLITLQNLNIEACFSQFIWFFSLKCCFKSQIVSQIHLSLPNAYKLMCFDRNINGNVNFLEYD